jgi:CRISP-associated protein Cas1
MQWKVHVMTYGASLRVKDGIFEILTPDVKDKKTLIRHEYAVSHVESIWMHASATVSTAALHLAVENDIDFVLCNHHGMPIGRFMPHRPSTTSAIQKAQLMISQTPHAITYVKEWIGQKLTNQMIFLEDIAKKRKDEQRQLCQATAKKIGVLHKKIIALEGTHIAEIASVLRGLEGAACKVYFETLNAVLPKYYRFEKGRSRQPADDLFNAFLNYGYAILYNRVEIAVTKAGLSPFIGYLHRDDYGAFRGFVFDVIEPYRVEIDRLVYRLFSQKLVSYEQHGTVADTDKAGTWLSTDGKKLISANFTESFDKWQFSMGAALRHTASTMQKNLNVPDAKFEFEPVLPHVFG